MPLIPFGEYRPDVTDYDQSSTAAVLNALPRGDGYGPFPAFAAYSAVLAGPCRGFFKAIKTDGSIAIFAATSTRLYQLNNTNQTWTDVSKGGSGGSGYSAVSSTDQWQFVQFINYVIAVQANAPPQFFDLTSATLFADLAGSPPQARYAAVVGSFVVLSGLVNNPYRVQWSALGDPTGWSQSAYHAAAPPRHHAREGNSQWHRAIPPFCCRRTGSTSCEQRPGVHPTSPCSRAHRRRDPEIPSRRMPPRTCLWRRPLVQAECRQNSQPALQAPTRHRRRS
jgi:hypothetical protein